MGEPDVLDTAVKARVWLPKPKGCTLLSNSKLLPCLLLAGALKGASRFWNLAICAVYEDDLLRSSYVSERNLAHIWV